MCAGYRNEQDLLFRDETALVTAKVAEKLAKGHENGASAQSTSGPAQCQGLRRLETRLGGQKVTVEHKAIDHLLNYYFRRSSFHYVSSMYSNTKPGSLFHQTVQATALAAYSHEIDEPDLLDQARYIYGNALIQLKETLATLEVASDETLATVLLMSRFETLSKTADGDSMSETWSNHVVGAFELVNDKRDQGSFPSQYSIYLVEQTVHNYNLFCLRALKRRPDALLDLSKQLVMRGGYANAPKMAHLRLKLHAFTDAYCAFSTSRKSRGTDDSIELIEWAGDLDKQCLVFVEELAATSKYKVVDTAAPNSRLGDDLVIHSTTYHVYPDHFEARIWNGIRMLRLSLNESIYSNAKSLRDSLAGPADPLYLKFEGHMEESGKNILGIVEEVCASAPQFLRNKGHSDCSPAAGCLLAWPLYIAAKMAPEHCGDYVAERLLWIGRELKIQAASIAAADLKEDGYRDDWLYACYMF